LCKPVFWNKEARWKQRAFLFVGVLRVWRLMEAAVAVAFAVQVPVDRAVTAMAEADKVRRLFERSGA
jgi:uncharacterized membrane protein